MLTEHDLITRRLALVREDLDDVLRRLTDDLLPWAPAAGMRTVRGQLVEIASMEVQCLTWMTEGREISCKEAENFGGAEATLDGLNTVLRNARAKSLAYIKSLSEGELKTPVPFPAGWFESLRLAEAPRAEAFRSIAAHEYYHTGQLVSYLWSRGDDPYKW